MLTLAILAWETCGLLPAGGISRSPSSCYNFSVPETRMITRIVPIIHILTHNICTLKEGLGNEYQDNSVSLEKSCQGSFNVRILAHVGSRTNRN